LGTLSTRRPIQFIQVPEHRRRKEVTMPESLKGLAVTALALLMLLAGPARAQGAGGFELITAAEARQAARAELEAPPEIRPRQVPGPKGNVPGIRVLSPSAQGAVMTAPLRIELAFTPTPGTRIVPSSFRVLYGLLKIDLTERLRQHATVTESGVVVDRAVVPEGQHRLILQVADDQGNSAEQELRIRVGAAS
jgi:hypothetical protein